MCTLVPAANTDKLKTLSLSEHSQLDSSERPASWDRNTPGNPPPHQRPVRRLRPTPRKVYPTSLVRTKECVPYISGPHQGKCTLHLWSAPRKVVPTSLVRTKESVPYISGPHQGTCTLHLWSAPRKVVPTSLVRTKESGPYISGPHQGK